VFAQHPLQATSICSPNIRVYHSIFAVSQLFSFPLAMHKVVKKEKGGIFLFKDRKKKMEILANYLELPKDLMLDLPRITLLGNIQLIIENHRGIIEYTKERIRISTSLGELLIDGEGLVLRNIFPDEIAVDGKIASLKLVE
jgi:sporulation protein YqfC